MRVSIDASALPVGAVLLRTYKGEEHRVDVTGMPMGHGWNCKRRREREAAHRNRWWRYIYKGKRYKSLSAIAREITGDPTMSGNRFFGLRRRTQ